MSGIFSQCPASFRGQRDPVAVEEFLSAICIYKEINAVSNTDALREMPLLLKDYAASWWVGVQDIICTFEQAVALIRSTFSPPDWQIFADFFEIKQQKNEPTNSFVSKKRYLLSQLKLPPSEVIQLNMVYALLSSSIKEQVRRENINSFEDLISASREAEIIILESPSMEQNKTEERRSNRCSFCRSRGHSIEACLKKQKRDEEKSLPDNQISVEKNEAQVPDLKRKLLFSCYGCGAPNVYKSNCSPCNSNWTSNYSTECYAIGHSLPTIKVKFFGIKHEVVFDTGAKTSVANQNLYQALTANGCIFQDIVADINLANGTLITTLVMTTTADVFIGNRMLQIHLIYLPKAKNKRSLLGTDFLEQAGIGLNMAQRYWFFEDENKQKYSFKNSMEPKTCSMQNENPDVSTILLSSSSSSARNSTNLFSPPAKIRKV